MATDESRYSSLHSSEGTGDLGVPMSPYSRVISAVAQISGLLFGSGQNEQTHDDPDVWVSIDDDGTGYMMRGQKQLSRCEAWRAYCRYSKVPYDIEIDFGCMGCQECYEKYDL